MSQVEFKNANELADFMSRVTNERYKVVDAVPGFPPAPGVGWYLLSLGELPNTAYAHKVWDDKGMIRIESTYLGNTTEWLELDYGEREAAEAIFTDGSDLPSIRKFFREKYPLEDRRLAAYQTIIDAASTKYGINLSIRCQGSELGATFFIDATIDFKGVKKNNEAALIKRNLSGLKDAWKGIKKYERAT